MTRLPRLVARGYPAAVPDAPASVTHFYDEITSLERPACDQFVILISWGDHMPLTSTSPPAVPPPAAGALRAGRRPVIGFRPLFADSVGRPKRESY